MDTPMTAQVRNHLKIQKALGGDGEYLRNVAATCKTHHDFAAVYLAMWAYLGSRPDVGSSKFIDASVKLADDLRGTMDVSRNIAKPDAKPLEPIQRRLTTGVEGSGYIVGPSDAARREAKIQRELDGKSGYNGPRFVQPKLRGMNGLYGTGRNQNQLGW